MLSDQLVGHWVHAQEEDTEAVMVFRPAGTDLPPARGRLSIELRSDGTFAEGGYGATDVPDEGTGSWALDGDTITLSEGAAQGVPRRMEIVTADADRLVIHRHPGGR